jgi:methyl-accepting chemotaxis protein
VVGSVTREANTITASATDFSAMSEELAASSGEISTAMVRVATSAEQQRSGMEQAGALLEALRAASASNAQAATRVVHLGDRIRTLAAEHRGDVENAGRTLLDVREVVQTSARQVQELARQSEAITEFIDLIKQISSQTNLLALNAAIEAARAAARVRLQRQRGGGSHQDGGVHPPPDPRRIWHDGNRVGQGGWRGGYRPRRRQRAG